MRNSMTVARAAFSLVELLVVIGIIALLVAILLPTLAVMREHGRRTQCLSNLRSIGQAGLMHVNEHRGYLPIGGWQWNPVDGVVDPHGLGDDGATKFDYYLDAGIRRPLPITAAFAHYLGVDVRSDSREHLAEDLQSEKLIRLFRCPSQIVPQSNWTQKSSEGWTSPDETTSYAMNEAALSRRDHTPEQQNAGVTWPYPMGQITAIRHPSEVFLFCDGRLRDEQGDRSFYVFDFGQQDTLYDFKVKIPQAGMGQELLDYFRHRRKINVLFADGHVETDSMEDGGLQAIGVSKGIY